MTTEDKSVRFDRVARAVVTTLLRGGPSDLKVSTIARRAEVSRAWVYKYFGSDRDELIAFTARRFGEQFADLGQPYAAPSVALWREHIEAATLKGLDDAAERPWVLTIHFRYRDSRDALGKTIRDIERRHLQKFVREIPASLSAEPGATRFATLFTQARLGVYMWWKDPAARERHDRDEVAADLMAWLDAFAARRAPPE